MYYLTIYCTLKFVKLGRIPPLPVPQLNSTVNNLVSKTADVTKKG